MNVEQIEAAFVDFLQTYKIKNALLVFENGENHTFKAVTCDKEQELQMRTLCKVIKLVFTNEHLRNEAKKLLAAEANN